MKRRTSLFRSNMKCAEAMWGELSEYALQSLEKLSRTHVLSVGVGDIQLLNDRWYVTHAGLLRIAERRRCFGIRTAVQKDLCDLIANRWVFRATVYKAPGSRGFVGYGDADPSNVSPLVRGAEMRIAETRAFNRALRKAYGIGLCSVEELGWLSGSPRSSPASFQSNGSHPSNSSHNGQPRLRDQLCLLIRQYNLDPTLVKAYAADFCGTQSLKEASRDLVESFISHLAAAAKEDRDVLVRKLNSYAPSAEVKP